MAEEAERNEGPEPCLFNRKIHFHVARKPFNGFGNGSTNGFKLVTLNPNSGIHQLSGSGKKPETAEYFDSGMDPELRWEITVRRIGAGLRNLGNTCFLNSVLQCLTYTEPLAAYLQSGKHQNSCRTTGFCALCAIQKHVSRALQATGRILEPKDLVSNLRCISRSFRNARQEDAHEYMVNLLESMHRCCLPSGVPSESASAYEKSLVHKIFGGRLRSQVKCMQCSFCSNKFDPFLDLSLEILKADSLQKALCHFTAKEQLDGGAKQYQCQQCKQKVKALKQLTIHKAPLVLSVHLKRFGHIHGQKIDKKIAFGSTLNLKPFVSGTYEGDLNYTLYGVLVHAGWSTHSGHYYCFVRTSSGMWYSLDDNQVIQVNERKVLEQKAYMLFYVRDRNSFCRKKPVNILQKENIAKNPNGASAYSKISRDSNEKAHNDSTENKVDASISATLSTIDGQVATVPKNSPSEMISLPSGSYPPSDTLPGVRSPHSRKDPQTLGMNNFGSTASKIDCNNGISAVQGQNPSVFVVPADRSVPKNSNHQKEASGCVAMPSTCSGDKTRDSPNQPVDQLLDSKTPFISPVDACKMDGPNYGKCNGTMPVVTNTEAWNQANCVKLPNENCAADNLVGVDQRSGNAAIEGTRKLKIMAKNKQPQFKVKRKRLKCQAAILLLGSSIILGASFAAGKKKYKPRNQPCMPMVSDGLKPSSCGSDLPSNTEQSLSDKSSLPTDDFTRSRKKVKLISSHENQEMSSNNSISRDVHSDCTERIVLGGGTSAADNQRGTGDSEELARKSREKNVMRMLTQGLEETTVARWDGIDAFSERNEIRGTKSVQIGYIGDEWDEEYDQGKRKKLRQSKMNFDGRNVFQEIASRNSKQKRAKLDRKISENPPFRIL